jgi:broad specificity polyphosphatase/5'/3'-nucleotidase SurE
MCCAQSVGAHTRPYFWRGFAFTAPEAPPDTDVGAFYSGHVTVTPIKLDWTDQAELLELKKWGLAEEKKK